MPQAVHETINLGDFTEARPGIGTYTFDSPHGLILTTCPDGDPPRQEQAQRSQEESVPEFRDSSEPLFSMYLKLAEEDDKRIAEHWRADAGGILVFVSPISSVLPPFGSYESTGKS
jgi:hypothetical protein